ncbi:MAG TPA: cytochrome c oxidase subunit 3 [Pyrinomonadaceae bacterium]|nr:cytochrome c oxidase subunit 3 [Pyrinomonadaceae bacterium]
MAVTATTKTREGVRGAAKGLGLDGLGQRPKNGNGSKGPRPPGGDGGPLRDDAAPFQYRIGMWVAVAAILMMFAALTSAYVFRAGTTGWQPLAIPPLMWASTAVILASSATFELARRGLKSEDAGRYRLWLWASLALGALFLIFQLLAWRQLVAQGIYLATNPHSSFFYVLTGLHGLHLAGGIAGLGYLIARARRESAGARREARALGAARADAVGIYWHFMDGLWLYLFGLLFFWR